MAWEVWEVWVVITKPGDVSSRSSPSNQRLIMEIPLKKKFMKKNKETNIGLIYN